MLTFITFFQALVFSSSIVFSGFSTHFSDHDKFNPNPRLACITNVNVQDYMSVVAHRTLECGTLLFICNPTSNKCTEGVVADRGPYGCLEKQNKKCIRHRAELDLTKAIIKEIEHDGFDFVYYTVLVDNTWEKKKRLNQLKEEYQRRLRYKKKNNI